MGATEGQPALPKDTLYRYRDAQGVEHLVQGLDEVPQRYAGSAEPVRGGVQVEDEGAIGHARAAAELEAWKARAAVQDLAARHLGGRGPGLGLNLPTLALGGGLVLALILGLSALRRGRARTVRVVAAAVLAALAAGAYFGGVRPAAAPIIEGPTTPIERAREAAEAVQRSTAEQQRTLDEIQRSGR